MQGWRVYATYMLGDDYKTTKEHVVNIDADLGMLVSTLANSVMMIGGESINIFVKEDN